jgi:prepilin-type N-terminal cleavage/methylation domain-containing protein
MRSIRKYEIHQSGFTLVEVMIAIVILGGGLLALAVALTQGMVILSTSRYNQIAKEKASEAMESVFASRDARKIASWNSIKNHRNGGIFLDGPRQLRAAGPDGLVNTADDGNPETVVEPGPDKIMGTADDAVVALDNFQREIEISDVAANLRQIRIIVSYTVGRLNRQYQLTSFISPFS